MTAFADVESEKRWVKLAERGLADLDPDPADPPAPNLAAVLDQMNTTNAVGNAENANAVRAALEDLYRDDPKALDRIRISK